MKCLRRSSTEYGASLFAATLLCGAGALFGPIAAQPVPPNQRGDPAMERMGTHDAGNMRTLFWNFGMIGDRPANPTNVDLSVFHSVEAPRGSGMNNSDGITPFVLSRIVQSDNSVAYIMETGFNERQGTSPNTNRIMRFEPRPGYFQADPEINLSRSPALSSDPRTWPDFWPDKLNDPDDPGWRGSWNGYFGKRADADQESFMVLDDQAYDAWPNFVPDQRDPTRRGLALRIEVRSLQWSHELVRDVIFWHYDITNEGTTDYNDNLVFGVYMDPAVGGSSLSCDGIYESDDDNAYYDTGLDMGYSWDNLGHGVDLSGPCGATGYVGCSFLQTAGNPFDAMDNDLDGLTDERQDGDRGVLIYGRDAIRAYVVTHYDTLSFAARYGPLENRPAYVAEALWTGDEDMDWTATLDDLGADGLPGTQDTGEGDQAPTDGEPDFGRADLHEADQLGLTGFKFNRIHAGPGNPDPTTDGIVFFTNALNWPQRLWEKFTAPNPADRFDPALIGYWNIGVLFASGPFTLAAGQTTRFSLALAYAPDLTALQQTAQTAQLVHDDNYEMLAVDVSASDLHASSGPEGIRLEWRAGDDFAAFQVWRAEGEARAEVDYERLDSRGMQSQAGRWQYLDADVVPGEAYSYRLEAIATDAAPYFLGPVVVRASGRARWALDVLGPNPGRDSAHLRFDLPVASEVRVEVFDVLGRCVRHLVAAQLPAGRHPIVWDGQNDAGHRVAGGLYVVRLAGSNVALSRRVILLR